MTLFPSAFVKLAADLFDATVSFRARAVWTALASVLPSLPDSPTWAGGFSAPVSREALARAAGCSPATIGRGVAELRAAGHLEVVQAGPLGARYSLVDLRPRVVAAVKAVARVLAPRRTTRRRERVTLEVWLRRELERSGRQELIPYVARACTAARHEVARKLRERKPVKDPRALEAHLARVFVGEAREDGAIGQLADVEQAMRAESARARPRMELEPPRPMPSPPHNPHARADALLARLTDVGRAYLARALEATGVASLLRRAPGSSLAREEVLSASRAWACAQSRSGVTAIFGDSISTDERKAMSPEEGRP